MDDADAKPRAFVACVSHSVGCGGGGVNGSSLAYIPSYVLGAPGPLMPDMLPVGVWKCVVTIQKVRCEGGVGVIKVVRVSWVSGLKNAGTRR